MNICVCAAYYPDADMATRECRLQVCDEIVLCRRSPYAKIVRDLGPALCKTSDQSAKAKEPLWKVSLVPDSEEPDERFCVVVSGNHSLLDGHDFYRLYNMLSGDSQVKALNPIRKQQVPASILAAMGSEPSLMALSPPGFIVRFISAQLRNYLFPATQALGFCVSDDWIADQKSALKHKNKDVPFVSTNDILVSTFSRLTACDVSLMAINFRDRVDGCSKDDVGNYEDLLCYSPSDYASPALIRKSVSPDSAYTAAAQPRPPLPTNIQHLSGATYAAITNWATFARPLVLAGAAEDLHVPLFDWPVSTPACAFSAMVIFRPSAGRVGVMVAGKSKVMDAVRSSGMVGDPLDITM